MKRHRKTIEVDTIKAMVNDFLLNSEDLKKDARDTLATYLEVILMDTGNYRGYNYLSAKDMEQSRDGISVGIVGTPDDDVARRFHNTDHTRVRYY